MERAASHDSDIIHLSTTDDLPLPVPAVLAAEPAAGPEPRDAGSTATKPPGEVPLSQEVAMRLLTLKYQFGSKIGKALRELEPLCFACNGYHPIKDCTRYLLICNDCNAVANHSEGAVMCLHWTPERLPSREPPPSPAAWGGFGTGAPLPAADETGTGPDKFAGPLADAERQLTSTPSGGGDTSTTGSTGELADGDGPLSRKLTEAAGG